MIRRSAILLLLVAISFLYATSAFAPCPTNHGVLHPGMGAVGNVAESGTSCPTCYPRFWCLSGGATNNNGTYTSWWQRYSTGLWWYDGTWSASGVNGCCGMWNPNSFDSRTMQAVVDQARNEGTINHAGEYEAEVCERRLAGGTDFLFSRETNWNMAEIPRFQIGTFTKTVPGGITTIQLTGWSTPAGPVHYWVRLQNDTIGTDLTLNNLCSPGGTSPCPAPIVGYQIRGMHRGCLDGTCQNPTPNRPTTSLASAWNATVLSGTIDGRSPVFPLTNIQILNPSTCTATNQYLFIATQLIYSDGQVSKYVSRNSTEMKWCN